MANRLPTRNFRISWHWRDDDPAGPFKTDDIKATTVPRAIGKLIRALSEEYDGVRSVLIVVAVVPTD
jgi:hypothetical protein